MSNTLNEEQYRKLREACDRVLLGPETTIERVAISWLHIIREHPVFLDNYLDVVDPRTGIKSFINHWLRRLRNWAVWVRQLGRAIIIDRAFWPGAINTLSGTDVLFVSHLLNVSHAGKEDDFYYGNLPNDLDKNNLTGLIALINHSGKSRKQLSDKWNDYSVPRVVLPGSLLFLEEVSLYQRLRKESKQLKKLARREDAGLYRRVLNRASEETTASGSHAALRIAIQINTLVAQIKPKAIVVTHEGHAWERVVFAAARTANPDIRCIGYQHSALFRLQHAIQRSLGQQYNPDQILTAGAITCAQLRSISDLEQIPISVLGTNRICKESTVISGHMSKQERMEPEVCLVLPEGIASECHLLFEYSLACAKQLPHINFIWRLHPILSFETIVSQNPRLKNLPGNIVLSNKTIGEDIACSRWALYRGTTAVIQAVNSGLQPIYLKLPGEMTIDPLYELESWRVKVESVTDFIRIVCTYDKEYSPSLKDEADAAKKYCKNYFLPFDYKVLNKSIENKLYSK